MTEAIWFLLLSCKRSCLFCTCFKTTFVSPHQVLFKILYEKREEYLLWRHKIVMFSYVLDIIWIREKPNKSYSFFRNPVCKHFFAHFLHVLLVLIFQTYSWVSVFFQKFGTLPQMHEVIWSNFPRCKSEHLRGGGMLVGQDSPHLIWWPPPPSNGHLGHFFCEIRPEI